MADEISSRIANAILNGGRAKQQQDAANEAAARQAAAEEAERRAQEQARRIQNAQHYRADWDARQKESGQRLAGVFDTGGTTFSAFFGLPNADAKAIAAILGDTGAGASPAREPEIVLPDTAVVRLLQQPTGINLRGPAPPPLSTTPAPELPRGKEENAAATPNELKDGVKARALGFVDAKVEQAEDDVKEWVWGLFGDGTVGRTVKEVRHFDEHRKSLTEKIAGIYTDFIDGITNYCNGAVGVVGSLGNNGLEETEEKGKEVGKRALQIPGKLIKIAFGEVNGE
jgi:hypothetical protein